MKKYFLILSCLYLFSPAMSQIPRLWGTMQLGGSLGQGTIYRVNGDGTDFTIAHAMGAGSSQGNLTLYTNNTFYGLTVAGGSNAKGTIFKYDPFNNQYTTVFTFNTSDGYYPRASLFLATDGNFYGMTAQGGLNNEGGLFQFNPVTNVFVKIIDFGLSNGNLPNGNVVQSGNKIIGMTTNGGNVPLSGGVIFTYDIITNQYFVVHNFLFATGYTPFGSLIKASNGLLYGMAFGGGSLGYGVIFSFNPTGNVYTVLHNFDGINGAAPSGALVQSGTSGLFYGFTQQGGDSNNGIIFSFDITGNTFTKLYDLDSSTGQNPNGSPIIGSDGKLYGHAISGGANALGTTFSFDPGSGTFTVLYDGSFATGASPNADLIEFNVPLSVNDIVSESAINLYPNPVSSELKIDLSVFNGQQLFISIISLEGKLVSASKITGSPDSSLPVNGLVKGSYTIRIETESQIIYKKFMKI
jgi:uncharacterized repeat protein (TIGR03803 family)